MYNKNIEVKVFFDGKQTVHEAFASMILEKIKEQKNKERINALIKGVNK